MKTLPEENDDYAQKHLGQLNPALWMLETLKYNAGYVHWAPGDDYMCGSGGFSEPRTTTFAELSELDDYNECAHFYFEIVRDHKPCVCAKKVPYCAGNSPELQDAYLAIQTNNIDEDDISALIAGHCFRDIPRPSIAEVNAHNATGYRLDWSHPLSWSSQDFNKYLIAKARTEKKGLPTECTECQGSGALYLGEARLNLVLWWLYPRKGASGGVTIEDVKQEDMPKVFAWLRHAAERNAAKFVNIPSPPASEVVVLLYHQAINKVQSLVAALKSRVRK